MPVTQIPPRDPLTPLADQPEQRGLFEAQHWETAYRGFNPDDVSPEKAVAERRFPILLICGTRDHTIPCRHAERIYKAASGPKELWIVQGAEHASALGAEPVEYEERVIRFFRVN